jgi:integrase
VPKINIKGVKVVRAKSGEVYYYNRDPWVRLRSPFGSAAFLDELRFIRGGGAPEKAGPNQPDGTIGGLIQAYRLSPEFLGLKPASRAGYERVFTYLRPLEHSTLPQWTSAFVLKLRDKTYAKRGRWLANYVVTVLSIVMQWGRPRGWTEANTAEAVNKIPRPKNMLRANRPWSAAERKTVLAEAPVELQIPIAIGMFAGQRESDALAFPRSGFDGQSVWWRAAKNGREIWLPAHPDLIEILAKAKGESTIFALNSRGRPWTESGFRASFFKFLGKLRAKGKIEPGLTFYGLRHTLGDTLAEAGCSTRQISDVLGITEEMARHYSRGADAKHNVTAAIAKMKRSKNEFWKKSV